MGDYFVLYFIRCAIRLVLIVLVLLALAFLVGYWFAGHSVKVRSPIVVQESHP